MNLTQEETKSVELHPFGCNTPYLDLNVRKIIAQKLEEYCNTADTTASAEIREIYDKFPRWCFYTDRENIMNMKRVYGVRNSIDKIIVLHTITYHGDTHNITLDTTLSTNLIKVDDWSPEQQENIIRNEKEFGLLLDPLGWCNVIEE